MHCETAQADLTALIDGELSFLTAWSVRRHLTRCPRCAGELASLSRLNARLLSVDIFARDAVASTRVPRSASLPGGRPRYRTMTAALAAVALLAIVGLALTRSEQARWGSHRGTAIVRSPDRDPLASPAPPAPRRPSDDGKRMATSFHEAMPGVSDGTRHPFTPLPGASTGKQPKVARALFPRVQFPTGVRDDLEIMNDDGASSVRQWAMVSSDEWERIAARVRGSILVRDDFVYVPFPRLAANSNQQVAAAVESYKREAAIVDPRLSREVTLAAKATALSDLCDRVRSESGIRVEAGRSVADEKVTVFCEKMPLRDVMRQLARPFSYTWLRSGKEGEYRYELVQDLRSQLLEEELRNRDRNAALLALEREIERYRPLMSLSPDETLARSKTATPAEKQMLGSLATTGWGPLQMYFRLSPQELATLRAGQTLRFGQEPRPDEAPLPPEVARGVLERWRNERFVRTGDGLQRTEAANANGLLLAAIPEARARVTVTLNQSELGRFTLTGGSGFTLSGAKMASMTGRGPYAVGQSPRVLQPDNRLANAALARDPTLRKTVTITGVQAFRRSGVQADNTSTPERPNARTPERLNASAKVTSADVLETLHRASGMPIVADYYTRLYAPRDVTVQSQPLFEALNRLADTMRQRWTRDGEWLQFRSTSYYDDRMKEVPNRLLARWSKSRQEHGALSLEELSEIAQLSDTQLQAEDMAAGARELFGLEEWNLARGPTQRSHLRYLAGFTPAQRQAALSPAGLSFARMSLAQQQEFIAFAFVRYTAGKGGNAQGPNVDLQDLAHALLRIDYAPPIGFEWRRPSGPGTPPDDLFRLRGPTREAALAVALRVDPQASPAQIMPAERTLTFAYLWGRPEAGQRALAVRATDGGAMIWGPRLPPVGPASAPGN